VFAPKRVAALEPDVRQLANQLIDGFIGEGQVEFYEAYCTPLPCNIFVSVLGLPSEDLPILLTFKESVIRPQGDTPEERFVFQRQAGAVMYRYLSEELDRRYREPEARPDLIGGLMTTEVDADKLSKENIMDICYLLVFAGLDTVTSSMSCIIAWLAQHPAERRRVMEDPALLPAAIEELMRFESPVPLGSRFLADEADVAGQHYPAGQQFELLWSCANVDPAAFGDPLRVDFERTDNRHIAFASGFHRCLGSHLARLELRVGIDALHRKVKDYWLTEGEALEYTNESVRAAVRLPLSFQTTD
jgi:cytochrome P450